MTPLLKSQIIGGIALIISNRFAVSETSRNIQNCTDFLDSSSDNRSCRKTEIDTQIRSQMYEEKPKLSILCDACQWRRIRCYGIEEATGWSWFVQTPTTPLSDYMGQSHIFDLCPTCYVSNSKRVKDIVADSMRFS